MPTVSIYLIGTGHDKDENYNILVLLHKLTAANEVRTEFTSITQETLNNVDRNQDAKVLFDGVPTAPDTITAGLLIEAISNACLSLCQKMIGDVIVNVVGHSRGGINAVVLANKLTQLPTAAVNLFLIDPVRHASIPAEQSLLIRNNVQDCRQFVMEDEASIPRGGKLGSQLLRFTSGALFKLAHIRRSLGPLPENVLPITTILLPGTHGTASQCGPITQNGKAVRALESDRLLEVGVMWPIGAVSLFTILLQLHLWKTKLRFGGAPETLADFFKERIVRAYARIPRRHPFVPPASRLAINDMKVVRSGEKQIIKLADGGIRTDEFLSNQDITPNEFRGHKVFVNEHHFKLFQELYFSKDNNSLLMRQLQKVASPRGSLNLLESLNDDDSNLLQQELDTLRTERPITYEMLRRASLQTNGRLLPPPKRLR